MEIKGIILRTTDLERSTAFWSEVVGLAMTGEAPGYTFLDGGSVSLTLSVSESLPFDEALTEIVFGAVDVRETYRAMADRGVPFEGELGPPIMSRDGQDLVGASFRDPDGHYGLLSGWVSSDAG
jgi:catechol 2,3-dioxygenase-like lactoylglutathione lyase family enzyme